MTAWGATTTPASRSPVVGVRSAHQHVAQWLVCHAMRSGAGLVIFSSRHAETITKPLWVRRDAYMPVAQVARDGVDIFWRGPCRHAGNRRLTRPIPPPQIPLNPHPP